MTEHFCIVSDSVIKRR